MPSLRQLLLAGMATTAALAAPVEDATSKAKCPQSGGAMVLAARGSTDGFFTLGHNPQYANLSTLRGVADGIVKGVGKGSFVKALDYPAVQAYSANYSASVNQGVSKTHSTISQFLKDCGQDSRVVLLGFSQGAEVMSQSLYTIGNNAGNIHAAAVFGDPTFVDNIEPLDVNTSTGNGVIANQAIQEKVNSQFGGRARSYCRKNDNVCSPSGDTATHLSEPSYWHDKAVKFVVGQF